MGVSTAPAAPEASVASLNWRSKWEHLRPSSVPVTPHLHSGQRTSPYPLNRATVASDPKPGRGVRQADFAPGATSIGGCRRWCMSALRPVHGNLS